MIIALYDVFEEFRAAFQQTFSMSFNLFIIIFLQEFHT